MPINIDEFTKENLTKYFTSTHKKDAVIKLSNEQIELFLSATYQISLAKDIETLMAIVRTTARELTNADGATFVLREGDKCFYADEDAIEPLWKGKRFPMKICISGWVMVHKQTVVIEDIYSDPRIPPDAYKPTFVKSLAMTPIGINEPVGAIGAYWARQYKPTPEELFLLESLAECTSDQMKNL